MANKTNNLHIRVTPTWLAKLDHLCELEGATSRSAYIKQMVETRYALDKEIGDLLLNGMTGGDEHEND